MLNNKALFSISQKSWWWTLIMLKILSLFVIHQKTSLNKTDCKRDRRHTSFEVTSETILIFLKYSWFTMLCQFLLYSKVTQSYLWVTHTHIYIPFLILSSIMVYPKRLDIYIYFLCYTVGSHWVSILNVIVCIY